MKKHPVLLLTAFVFLLPACSNPSGGGGNEQTESPDGKTRICFVNNNDFPVTLYSDPARLARFAEVEANAESEAVETAPNDGAVFYLRYHILIDNIVLPYDGQGLPVRIDEGKIPRIPIPLLSELDAAELAKPLTPGVHIKIQNAGTFSLSLQRGSREEIPEGATSPIINSGETARYVVDSGPVSDYAFMKNTSAPLVFPAGLGEFLPGHLYSFKFNGTALTLLGGKSLTITQALEIQAPENIGAKSLANGHIALTWDKVGTETGYVIYRSDSPTGGYAPAGRTEATSYTDAEVDVGNTYYYRISAVKDKIESDKSTTVVSALAEIRSLASPQGLSVTGQSENSVSLSWQPVPGATSYKAYKGASAGAVNEYVAEIASASYAVTGSYTVTGLTANTACYFAVSAVYADGESLPSAAVYGKTSEIFHELTIAPVPVLIAGDGSITVSWDPVPFADSYNVYCNTDPVLPGTPYRTGITGSSAAITGLINDTTYYVWVEAVNSIGTKTGEAVPGVPQLPSVQEYTVYSDAGFTQAVAGINASSTRGIYRITLLSNITANNVSFSATSVEKTIILKGDTSLRTISKTDNTDLFVVRSGNTLALENNLNLNSNAKAGTMVQIDKGGTLVMKAGSRIEDARSYAVSVSGAFEMSGGKISGSTASSSCVYVSGGTFKMSGGEISGNRAFDDGGGVYVSGGAFEMSGGEISGNSVSASLSRGGGVYVFYNSTFTMSGGKISGNTAEFGGGVYIYDSTFTMSGGEISGNTAGFGGGVYVGSATFIKNGGGVIYGSNESTALKNTAGRGNNWGHAVSVYEGSRKRNTTAGTDVALYSNISGSAGGWE